MSLLAIILELYCIFRIVNIVAPSPLPLQRRAEFLIRDFRVVRAISLLIYDCIIIVPNSIQSTYLADSLPFSFAALVVLAVFNRSTQSPSTWESANLILSEHSLDADAPINISSVEHVKLSRNADNADPGPVVREKVKEIKPVLPSSSCTRGMRSSQYPVQPIIPKAELAQQFNDNEQTSTRPYAHAHALVPRPPVIAEQKRPVSTPIKYPAAAITRTNAKTQRCASIAHSTAQTFSSSVYGSDIIRPEPGRVLRDKMKLPPVDPPPVPIKLTAGVLDATVESPTRTLGFKKDSWLSDLTTEVHHALARALRNETSITSFGENWPLPPTTMPVPGRRKKLV
ncbi:hypothetical protein EW145_g5970 [Phellinidium pouzarii]|uniref:Uncharacterized protein n=1 Tax=Phellinidium pouzarii TaxID=167371 RepID=A0A4S4L004_9AGAM|nr:hypothetical protein EW145_g5970 [Phellinidium pouzarii]